MITQVLAAIGLYLANFSTVLAVTLSPAVKPFVRLEFTPHHMLLSKNDKFLAFTAENSEGLYVADLGSFKVISISPYRVGPGGFFFSPDGNRIFYRDHTKNDAGKPQSHLMAYDLNSHKRTILEALPRLTSYLTFDPRDFRLFMLHDQGILNKKISYPESALAKWQKAQRTDRGRWIVTQKNVIWLSNAGFTMRAQTDDGSGVANFALSPDGLSVAWSTKNGLLYRAVAGEKSVELGEGENPTWHPFRDLLLYSYPRKLGHKVLQRDLRIVDPNGSGKFVTQSQDLSELCPQWTADGKSILFAIAGSTDVYQIKFQ